MLLTDPLTHQQKVRLGLYEFVGIHLSLECFHKDWCDSLCA